MKKLFILLFLFSCSEDRITFLEGAQAQTPIANVDSVFLVLDSLKDVRYALADPTTNAAKRIYAEELFRYQMIDTLALNFPILINQTAAIISARIDSIILKHGKPDSTDDKGRLIKQRIDAFLALSLAERKSRIKAQLFIGKIVYASRNELISVIEQREYKIMSANKLQAIKKMVIGRLYAVKGASFTAFSFSNVTEFDNKLSTLRSQYFESEIR